jgi:threonine/homoserine/homoserine lactone efflux protein
VETLRALVAVSALAAVGIMSPGPDFVVVIYTAMTGARRRAGWVASGVVVVLVLSTPRASARFRRHKAWVEGAFGSMLAGFGLLRCLMAARELPASFA